MVEVKLQYKCGHEKVIEVPIPSTALQVVAAQHECWDCYVNSPILHQILRMGPPPDATTRIRVRAE